MKKFIRNIFVGAVAVSMLGACNLDLFPTTALLYDENGNQFQTLEDIAAFQNGVMGSYRAVQYGSYTQSMEVMCDGFNATTGFGNNYGSIHRVDDSFTPADEYAESMWAGHYGAIKNYNIAIANCEKVTDEELKPYADVLKGIASFCRASSYLTLTRVFGNDYNPETASTDLSVPLVLEFDINAKPARATVQQVYDQVLSDLETAENLLAEIEGTPRSQTPTVDAVRALMARYYLDIEEYETAAELAEEVIESEAGYALSKNANEMAAEYTNDSGSEPIMQLYASLSEGAVGNTIFTLVGKDLYGKFFGSYYIPTAQLIEAYDRSDLRYSTWFSTRYPVKQNGTNHTGVTVFAKYIDNPNLRSGSIETGAHAAKTLMISEMYLIAAEAYAMADRPNKAKTVLNDLQKARGAAVTAGDMASIMKEWYKETVGEGFRMFCIKRWGDTEYADIIDGYLQDRDPQSAASTIVMSGAAYTDRALPVGSYQYVWPVPSYEIKINPALVQNPGYSAI